MIDLITGILLTFLVVCALVVMQTENLLHAIIVFGLYSLIMAVIWQLFNAPDIAITEAAAGIATSTLMIVVLSRIRRGKN